MNTVYPRAECYEDFLPKITFWKVIGWLIVVVVASFGGITTMSTAMDAAIREDVNSLSAKASLIDRLDERTISIQNQLDRIEKKLQ